jgi:AbrB family looped-hinge helix DNA binding protein
MSSSGRLTIPADARRALGITGETAFDVEVVGEGIVLHPSPLHLEEDAWAYTPKHRELLRRALAESEGGQVKVLSEAELRKLAPVE